MSGRIRLRIWGGLLAGTLLLALAGCPPWSPWPQTPSGELGQAKLVPFASADELLSYFKEQARPRANQGPLDGLWRFGLPFAPAAAPADLAGADGAGAANAENAEAGQGLSFTTTNIQEAGVDESDVVKSDGTYFYIARGDTLSIVRAAPTSEMAEVGRLDLDLHVSEMYLYGPSKLILLAQRYEYVDGPAWERPEIAIWPPYFVGSDLTLVEVDVSDPAAPTVTKQVEVDGSLVDSRLTNDRLILVLAIAPELPEEPTTPAVNAMTLEEFMPKVRDSAGERGVVGWQDCLHPESPDGYYLTAVITLDADDIETTVHSSAIVAGAGTIYASTEALYVTDTEWTSDSDYRETTAIHKFEYDDDGAAQYVASGSVPGRLLNQFSLGEHQGYLRAATHVSNPGFFGWFDDEIAVNVAAPGAAQNRQPPSDFNAVYVLTQNGSELQVTGTIENVAPGEQLHSARFMGERGFLVTFRRIDPLFTLDLSDPNNPEVKGELKIPGYSDYLHPFGDNHLIGVGRSVITMSSWGGEEPAAAQLSLFDVSDLTNPTLVQQVELGGMHSWSYVTQTHKAFTLMQEQGLLAIPMRITDADTLVGYEYDLDALYGVVCFDVDPAEGFTELGRLEAIKTADSDYEAWYPSSAFWMRAAFIGQTLYAISPDGVRATPVADFTSTTTVELAD